MKCLQKKLDGNYTRMLHAVLNKSWRQHPTKQQLYGHLLPISSKICRICWALLKKQGGTQRQYSPMDFYTWINQCWLANKNYIHQLCMDTGCSLEDLPKMMAHRHGWWKIVKEICLSTAYQLYRNPFLWYN